MTTTTTSRARQTLLVLLIALAISGLAPASDARAGTYVVDGTCGAWEPFNDQADRLSVSPECPRLVARNTLGAFQTPGGAIGGWSFVAPAGTTIRAADLSVVLEGGTEWGSYAGAFYGGGGRTLLAACGAGGTDCGKGAPVAQSLPDATKLEVGVYCSPSQVGESCPNGGTSPRGNAIIQSAKVTVFDASPPSAQVAGGSVTSGWVGGVRKLAARGSDNTGIKTLRPVLDGTAGPASELPCDYSKRIPCGPANGTEVNVDLRSLADGARALAVQAEDAAGNAGSSGAVTINVDNTPPTAVSKLRMIGKGGWRASNRFAVAWNNPPQQFAPIAAVNYQLCPQGQPLNSPGCKRGSSAGADVSQVAFQVPSPGPWTITAWPADAAGNSTSDQGRRLGGFGLLAQGKRTYLKAGKAKRKDRKLRRKLTVKRGRAVRLSGRLAVGARRHGLQRRVLVYRRTAIQGARYRLIKQLTTGKNGRFSYRARRGGSRRLMFVYPGGDGLRGRTASVRLRVRTKLTIQPDRRRLRNGETVTLAGRLQGGKIPPGGALLELQVFTRGRWRPFATPRTDPTGGWTQPYRFETVTGRASFRFRAVLRKQATYPFIARSRAVKIHVRGL